MSTLIDDIAAALNRHSRENASNTPDVILARVMMDALIAFERGTNKREAWYGRGKP